MMRYLSSMERIGVRELRQHASRYLALVKDGETVEVTERGELIAVLGPPAPARTARERLVASGRLIPASSTSGTGPRTWPVPVASEGPTNQQLLDGERAERL